MQNKSFGKNLFIVALSRLISLISGIAVGFLLPKILSVTDYGFYKVFTLYAVYTSLLHFGFVDGILLKISGQQYENLDISKMRIYTRFFVFVELVVSFVMLLTSIIFTDGEYLFIVSMLAVNMVFVNITTYYQFISQAVQRFGEYSAKNIVVSVIKVLFVLVLFAITVGDAIDVSYRSYLVGLNILDFLCMVWYIVIYREITFGKSAPIRSVKKDIIDIFKTGILQTLAYQVSHLILALDRQFVNFLFSTEDFAIYSFAYNIVTMISTMVSSASVILLPMLKNRTYEAVIGSYKKCLSTVSVIASCSLLCFFPLVLFVDWFLPKYSHSIEYIAIVLPAFIFTASITIVMFTITKIFDMNFEFFKDGCFIFVLGFVFNVLAYYILGTPSAISYASLIVMMIWFLLAGVRLMRRTGVNIGREFLYLSIVALGFIIITNFVHNAILGFFMYLLWLLIWTIILHKDVICGIVKSIKRMKLH